MQTDRPGQVPDTRPALRWAPPDPVTGQLTRRPPTAEAGTSTVGRRIHVIGALAGVLVVALGLGAAAAFGSSSSARPTPVVAGAKPPAPAPLPSADADTSTPPSPTSSVFDAPTDEPTPAPTSTGSTSTVFAGDIGLGDCLRDPITKLGLVEDVVVVPCSKPHAMEVYATYDLPGSAFPGLPAVRKAADQGCEQRFSAFVGRSFSSSSLRISNLHPTSEVWADGNKTVTCLVGPTSGTTTGSLRNSHR